MANTPPIVPPRRGGTHPSFGIYVGGDSLTTDYHLASNQTYNSTSQLRNQKNVTVVETSLHAQKSDTTSLKFNENLEVSTSSLTEYNMEGFMRAVGETVERFGFEPFFYIKHPTTGKMLYLPEEPHTFTLDIVETAHQARLVEPAPVMDPATLATELLSSVSARFACYDPL